MKRKMTWSHICSYTILFCVVGMFLGASIGIIIMANETRNLPACKTRIHSSLVINEVEYILIEKNK